ncbi:hypothetical protein [Oceanibaculum nanhaiense]|uniref:hypothetical protein n=1 Tax=Oceanibaculum nanhaiense TaxID=1909734 RepID=UPI003F6F1BC1
MKPTIIVANRTGGQGKTLLCQLIALGLEAVTDPPALVAIDTDTSDTRSKLGKFFGNVEELRISPDMEELRRDPRRAIAHWDRLGEIMVAGNAVIDVGANVIGSLLDWAILRRAGAVLRAKQAPPILLVVPMRAQAQAVEDALHILDRSIHDQDGLPIVLRTLVLNEASGTFERYGTNEDFTRLSAMKREHGLAVTRIGHCMSELWPLTEREYLSLRDVVALPTAAIEERFAMNAFAAAGAHAELLEWIADSLGNLRTTKLLPPAGPLSGATPALHNAY